jgi:hypothetical protein
MSTIYTLPAGTDVLRARQVDMAAANGQLTREPESTLATCLALAERTLGVEAGLAALDRKPAPDPNPLRDFAGAMGGRSPEDAGAFFNLGANAPWAFLEAMAPAVLAAEARLSALDKAPPVPDDVLPRMAAQKALDGFVHRHHELFHETVEMLVARVLGLEARLARLRK